MQISPITQELILEVAASMEKSRFSSRELIQKTMEKSPRFRRLEYDSARMYVSTVLRRAGYHRGMVGQTSHWSKKPFPPSGVLHRHREIIALLASSFPNRVFDAREAAATLEDLMGLSRLTAERYATQALKVAAHEPMSVGRRTITTRQVGRTRKGFLWEMNYG